MSEIITEYIGSKRIEGTLLERLQNRLPEEEPMFERLIGALSPSANTFREILRLVDEVAARDRITTAKLLSSPDLSLVFEDERLHTKEKQLKVKLFLESLRYPEVAKIWSELEECRKEIVKESGFRFELPKDLEGDAITCSLSLKTADDCIQAANNFKTLSTHPALFRIFSVLSGDV